MINNRTAGFTVGLLTRNLKPPRIRLVQHDVSIVNYLLQTTTNEDKKVTKCVIVKRGWNGNGIELLRKPVSPFFDTARSVTLYKWDRAH